MTNPTAIAVLITKAFRSLVAVFISFAFSVIAIYPIFTPFLITFLIVVNLNWLKSSCVNVSGLPYFSELE